MTTTETTVSTSICSSAYFNIKFWYLLKKKLFLWLHCLITTNGQLNDTRGYHIKPTNSTCSMISCFRLKGPCSFVRGPKFVLSAQSNFNYCLKVLSMKNIFINIKTKKYTPKSALRWEFASVYYNYYKVIKKVTVDQQIN